MRWTGMRTISGNLHLDRGKGDSWSVIYTRDQLDGKVKILSSTKADAEFAVGDPVETTWEPSHTSAEEFLFNYGIPKPSTPAFDNYKYGRVVQVLQGSLAAIYNVVYADGQVLGAKSYNMRKIELLEEMAMADELPPRSSS